jgi:hypothetical protein
MLQERIGQMAEADLFLPIVVGLIVAYLWLRGLSWSQRRIKNAMQPQVIAQRTSRTPLQVVWSSFVGCLTFGLLLAIPIVIVIIYLVNR